MAAKYENKMKKQNSDRTYDILILDKNSDIGDYETNASVASNAKMNRSYNSPTLAHERRRKRRNDRYSTEYSPTEVNHTFGNEGGLGPNIGNKKWLEEKIKRERIKDFALKLNTIKKENLIFSNKNL
jgi:hypothetical protein